MSRKVEDWIASYLKYVENSEPPLLYKEWVAISVIASVLQRKCKLPWGHLTFYPNMYVVLVGPSGICRKGTAMGVGHQFLRDLGINTAAEAITREALIRELRKANSSLSDPATGDIVFHASLTIYSHELTVFLGYNNLQLMSDLSDWYDCRDRWTYRTKHMGEDEIIGVWVNLIGATTPELLQSALPHDAIGGGLASRVVFIYERRKAKTIAAPFLTLEDKKLRDDLQDDLEEIAMMQGEFKITKDFLSKWIDWYTDQSDAKPFDERFTGYFSRRPVHVLKLSMILAASEGKGMTMDASLLNRAIDLLMRTEKNMPMTFRGVGKSDIADVTARVMAAIANEGEITAAKLLSMFYYDADRLTMDRILQTLEAMKWCKTVFRDKDVYVIYEEEEKEITDEGN